MASLTEQVEGVVEDHPGLASEADQDEKAFYRLCGRVIQETGAPPATAEETVEQILGMEDTGPAFDVEGFEEHMDALAERGDRSEWTAEAYTVSARKFREWFEAERGEGITPTADAVEDWLDHLAMEEDLKGSTIQRHFHGIKAYFAFRGREGDLSHIDVSAKYPDRSGGTPDHLDWGEVIAMREATINTDDPQLRCYRCGREWEPAKPPGEYDEAPRCTCDSRDTDWDRNPYEYAIVQILSGFGLRVGELTALDLDDVDLDDRTLTVTRQKRTEEWIDTMHLLESDVQAIENYLEYRDDWEEEHADQGAEDSDALFVTSRRGRAGWRADGDFIRLRVNDVAERADVRTYEDDDGAIKTEVFPHLLRHTVGHRLASAGFSDRQVGAYLGHSVNTTTSRYMSLDPEDFREMREAIEG